MPNRPSNKPPTGKRQILASGDHAFFRAEMLKTKIERQNHCQLEADPTLSRDTRLLARAYAGVYGVRYDDMNDRLAGPLTPFEHLKLPRLRREIRKMHELPHPIRMWWIMHPWAWIEALVLLGLFMVVFG